MYINLETADKNTIQAYSDSQVKINSLVYENNLVVSKHEILTSWAISNIQQLSEPHLTSLLKYKPDVIVIGHNQLGEFAPPSIAQMLSRQRIGLESMSIGAACRTYNVLLSEGREVVLGIIFAL